MFSTVSRPPGSARNRLGDPGLPGLTVATSNSGRDADVCGQARDALKIAMQTVRVAALMRNVERQIIYEDNTTMSFVCQGIYDAAGVDQFEEPAAHRKRDQFSLGFST